MQKIVLPFKKQMMLCGYRNPEYRKFWEYEHLGVDISTIQGGAGSDHVIYGSGDGEVVAVGKDNSLGWGVAILYKDVYNHQTGEVRDLIARYMHMSEVYVVKGQKVNIDTPIALEGKEGTEDYHLHIEFDTDIKFPTYSPQVSAGHTFWRKGTDSTVNPSFLFHVSKERQIVPPTYNPAWLNEEDFSFPVAEMQTVSLEEYKALKEKHENLLAAIEELIKKCA